MLSYRERAGSGTPALLIHGNFASSAWWAPLFEAPECDRRLIAPDLPGCGDSSEPEDPEGYSIGAVAHEIGELVERLGLRRFHLVGHSLGAAVAVRLLERHAHRVLDVSLFGPAPLDGTEGMKKGNGEMAKLLRRFPPNSRSRMGLLDVSLGSARMLGTHKLAMDKAIRAQMPGASLESKAFSELVKTATVQSNRTILGYLTALANIDHEPIARACELPVSVVWGELDKVVPLASARQLAKTFPAGRLQVWNGVGHSPMLETPDRTLDHLRRFWSATDEVPVLARPARALVQRTPRRGWRWLRALRIRFEHFTRRWTRFFRGPREPHKALEP